MAPGTSGDPSATGAHAARTFADGMTIGDHFVVRRKLGGGGMGEVYLAENQNVPDRRYAIKVLRSEYSENPRFVAMLQDEASKQSRLDHDNVVGMYDFFRWAGQYCLIQNFVDGKTLAQMIAEQPAGLDLPTAIQLMLGVLSGLDYAHEIGILHCDVKPANVIVAPDGRPRVTDFGIARDIGPSARDNGVKGAGTAEYMSPEQIRPPYDIDHRSDVFSAGVMFFEMLCGRLPFEMGTSLDPLQSPQLIGEAPDVRRFRPDVPEPIARIVTTALQRDPALRFQGCADFARALADYLRHQRWRRTWLPAIAVASIVAVAGAVGLYEWRVRVDADVKLREVAAVDHALRNAAASFNSLCRESVAQGAKRRGVEIAHNAGFDDKASQLQQQVADMDKNITTYAGGYKSAVSELLEVDAAMVAREIASQAAADAEIRGVANAISTDGATLRAGGSIGARDELLRRCPPGKTAGAG